MGEQRFAALEIKKLEVLLSRYAISDLKRKHGIDICPLQCEAIIRIHNNGGCMAQKQLENVLCIRKSTLSGMLTTMVKNGFVEKKDSDTDQRSKLVYLTDKGREFYDSAMEDLIVLDNTVMAGITDEEMETFFRIAETIRSNIRDE